MYVNYQLEKSLIVQKAARSVIVLPMKEGLPNLRRWITRISESSEKFNLGWIFLEFSPSEFLQSLSHSANSFANTHISENVPRCVVIGI